MVLPDCTAVRICPAPVETIFTTSGTARDGSGLPFTQTEDRLIEILVITNNSKHNGNGKHTSDHNTISYFTTIRTSHGPHNHGIPHLSSPLLAMQDLVG